MDIASAPRGFSVNTFKGAGEVMVSIHGDLDMSSVPRLDAALKRVVEAEGYRDIIVDLADARVVDMTGVSLLFKWSRFLRTYGVDLVLSGPSPSALEALKGSGLYEMLTITRA